ncbi:C-type lectin mannose-binding isoform-like isoform X1 [Oratosquilla oratoria]|uniref:C-type lectin mannose-binding isoform-like isoform X1 n=1 Tax=Oratosquilla oratoria TaxID=337810 RepID=UPI003F773298
MSDNNNHATDWNKAEQTCAAFHGTLAVFSNEAETKNIRKYLKLKDSCSVWVGANNTLSGTHRLWIWLDRSSVENRMWPASYPVKKEEKMCNYESRDIACTLKYPFICSQPVRGIVDKMGAVPGIHQLREVGGEGVQQGMLKVFCKRDKGQREGWIDGRLGRSSSRKREIQAKLIRETSGLVWRSKG